MARFCERGICKIRNGSHILPEGWSNSNGTSSDKSAFFAEFGNSGPGAATSQRILWSHRLTAEEAANYTLKNILTAELPVEEPFDVCITGKRLF